MYSPVQVDGTLARLIPCLSHADAWAQAAKVAGGP